MWFPKQVRPGIWVGFTDTTAGNLAFHVGDDPAVVAGRRAAVELALTSHAAARAAPGTAAAIKLAYMSQVHGAHVALIPADSAPLRGQGAPVADAMVTVPSERTASETEGSGSLGLAVMVADCVPVILVGDRSSGGPVLAVAHAGRPGVEKDVIGAVVAQMRSAGAERIEAWLGPSVCGTCYEVPEDMRASVTGAVPEAYAVTSRGTPALDLPAAVLAQLGRNGATAHPSGVCTLEDGTYYSHRRTRRDGGSEGRFIGFVAALPTPAAAGTHP